MKIKSIVFLFIGATYVYGCGMLESNPFFSNVPNNGTGGSSISSSSSSKGGSGGFINSNSSSNSSTESSSINSSSSTNSSVSSSNSSSNSSSISSSNSSSGTSSSSSGDLDSGLIDVIEDVVIDAPCVPKIMCQTIKQQVWRYCGNFTDDCGHIQPCDCDPKAYETSCGGYGWDENGVFYPSNINPNRCGGGCGHEANPVPGLCKQPYPFQWWCAQNNITPPPINAICILPDPFNKPSAWCCNQ